MSQESHLGLGFSSSASSSHNRTGDSSTSNTAPNDVYALMQHYMQQCLEYHEEKEKQEQHQKQQQLNSYQYQDDSTTRFIPATITTSVTENNNATTHVVSVSHSSASASTNTSTVHENNQASLSPQPPETSLKVPFQNRQNPISIQNTEEFQRKLQNAKAIAQRLASYSHSSSLITSSHPNTPNVTSTASTIPATIITTTDASTSFYPYAEKRKQYLQNVHSKRLHLSLLKNLDYLVKKDEEVHLIQMQHLNNYYDQKRTNQQQQQKKLQNTSKGIFISMGGIGSKDRNKMDRNLKRKGHVVSNHHHNSKKNCCGVYITGLSKGLKPTAVTQEKYGTNEQTQHDHDNEEMIVKQLFESYGKIDRLTLYVDKKTGCRKGDGLVLYDWDQIKKEKYGSGSNSNVNDNASAGLTLGADKLSTTEGIEEGDNSRNYMDSFLKLVCSQLNGVELPCGSIITAEPADMDYKNKKCKKSNIAGDQPKQGDGGNRISNDKNQNVCNKNECDNKLKTDESKNLQNEIKNHKSNEREIQNEDDAEEEEEDLDDFFASL